MNEIKIKVKFKKGLCYSQGIKLVQNDYNSTKLVFEFDEDEGTKIFEMKDDEDNVILADEIVNNELILARFDEHDNAYPIFTKEGEYVYEVSLYKDNSKLTSASDKFKVNAEQVIIDGEIVETYTPMFDNLLSDLSSALQETDNIDIDVEKVGNTSTVSITKKDGSTKTVNIIDGAKGDKGDKGDTGDKGDKGDKGNTGAPGQAGANATINGVNTLSIEAGTNITLEQEGSTLTINSTGGGSGGTNDYSALTNKPSINNVTLSGNKTISDLGLQPAGNYVTDTDYATEIKAGLVTIDPEFLVFVQGPGILGALCVSYDSYGDMYPSAFISKGTLENVITGKNLETANNKVTSISSESTDTQYPSAKCVHDSQATQDDEIEALQTENERLKATLPTTTGEGQDITLDKTAEMEFVKPPLPRGNSEQNGEPSPDNAVPITNVTGNVEVTISNENNTESKTLPVSLGNIELCKIGEYQDYLYKKDGKWYKYNAINKLVLNGSENWTTGSFGTNSYLLRIIGIKYPLNANDTGLFIKSSHFRGIPITSRLTSGDNLIYVEPSPFINIRNTPFTSISDFKTWLSTHNTIVYYVLETPTDTEVTDTTLISQLEEISKTLSYQGQTNITSNTIALFDVEAYQSTKLILENLDSRLTLVEG